MICKIRKLNGLEQYIMEWDEWDGFPKHWVEYSHQPSNPISSSTTVSYCSTIQTKVVQFLVALLDTLKEQ